MSIFDLTTEELWAVTLPYVIKIHEPDFDPEYDEAPEPPVWYAYIYTLDGYCLHDTNQPYTLSDSQRTYMFKLGDKIESRDDHHIVYLYKDSDNPIKNWDVYSNKIYKLFKMIEDELSEK